MAEFQYVIKHWRRMCKKYTTDNNDCCKGCPLEDIAEHGCGAIFDEYFADVVDWPELERRVMQWAAEHPEPVYPTWEEYLRNVGVIPTNQDIIQTFLKAHIPADTAQKLGIEPKEGV